MKHLLAWSLILTIAVGIPLITSGTGDSHTQVQVIQPQRRSMASVVSAAGTIRPAQVVSLRPEISGTVKSVAVTDGALVREGALVLLLDDAQMKAEQEERAADERLAKLAVTRTEHQKRFLKAKLARQTALFEKGLINQEELEEAQQAFVLAEVDVAEARERVIQTQATLRKIGENLARTRIHAPISGRVVKVDVKPGEVALAGSESLAGSTLMKLADTDQLVAEVLVEEAGIAEVALGQRVRIFPVTAEDTPVEGQVQSIAVAAEKPQDRQARGFKVLVALNSGTTATLRPGISCRAEIITHQSAETLLVPIESVRFERHDQHEKPFVFLLVEGKAHKTFVTLGAANDRYQEVVAGLEETASLVAGPYRTLQNLSVGDAIVAQPAR